MAKKELAPIENRRVSILKDGMNGPFWAEIKAILEEDKEAIMLQILGTKGEGTENVPNLIKMHNFIDGMTHLPETTITALEGTKVEDGTDEGESNDPYEKSETDGK